MHRWVPRMTANGTYSSEKLLGLHWLIRLRWIAVAGFVVICLVSAGPLGVLLPVPLLAACIGLVAASNGWLAWQRKRSATDVEWLVPVALTMDIVVLTVMLYFTSGANNPFTLFYLLHITLAVILLPAWGAWSAVGLCTAGFWLLFQSDHTLMSSKGTTCCDSVETHLRGLVVAMALTGCGITYFSKKLTHDLRESRRMVSLAQADGERARRSMEVATLAAGMAHELATPLGTIAVVSQDLEKLAGESGLGSACAEDARVIRKEVERCRLIIEKLGMAGRAESEDSLPLDWEKLGDLLSGYLPEAIRERLELQVRPSSRRPLFPQSRLFQCLGILIKNAFEASPKETPVVLEAETDAKQCVFRVIDEGEGFPEAYQARIGEPLVTTKSKSGGLGLGLYLVKAFVNERGGELRVESGKKGGTMVVMSLPLLEASK